MSSYIVVLLFMEGVLLPSGMKKELLVLYSGNTYAFPTWYDWVDNDTETHANDGWTI